jgi:predicted ATP-binding protein involved in virulence
MRLTKFEGHDIHGYLQFNIDFFSDVTFLHGINGCGKTTALRAMIALLTPEIHWLSATEYKSISIYFVIDGEECVIMSQKTPEMVHLVFKKGLTEQQGSFACEDFKQIEDDDAELSPNRIRYHEERVAAKLRSSEIFNSISQIPTPIFLGLERTTLSFPGSRLGKSLNWRRSSRAFSRSAMDISLSEADQLLQDRLAAALAEKSTNSEIFRESVTFSIFDFPSEMHFRLPNKNTLIDLKASQTRIIKTFQGMKFKTAGVEDRIKDLFSIIISRAEPLARFKSLASAQETLGDAAAKMFSEWFEAARTLKTLENIINNIEKFDEREVEILQPLDKYAASVNKFFGDSGKAIEITKDGKFRVKLPSGKFGDVSQLSSGEKQIFVLLTHLALNDLARVANVLIVDEPELSLHMEWQKGFAEAALAADPDLQLILATHSPAIIMNRENKCKLLEQSKL